MPNDNEVDLPAPSERFLLATLTGSDMSVICTFCKRIHFASAGGFAHPNEQALRNLAKLDSKQWIEHPGHNAIEYSLIGGQCYVHLCSCHGARQFEDFIQNNIAWIARYLQLSKQQASILILQLGM